MWQNYNQADEPEFFLIKYQTSGRSASQEVILSMEPEISSSYSKETANDAYPEPNESNPHPPTLFP
jgi:hypothetical protein